jgi:hypothetical protein
VDIAGQFEQIGVLLAKDGSVTALKNVPYLVVDTVEVFGVASEERTHEDGERSGVNLDEEMEVVGHKTVGVEGGGKMVEGGFRVVQKRFVIGGAEEEGTSAIAAVDDVVEGAGEMETMFARHE